MEWRGRRGSGNIEDRRTAGRGRATAGVGGGLGVVAIVVIGWFLGVDLTPLLTKIADARVTFQANGPGGGGGGSGALAAACHATACTGSAVLDCGGTGSATNWARGAMPGLVSVANSPSAAWGIRSGSA